jgi:two-component system NtrC family response regulator
MEKNKAEYLGHLVAVTQGDIKACCRISGLSRGHLYRLMQQYDIKNNADS